MSLTELLHVMDSKSNVNVTDKALHLAPTQGGELVDVNNPIPADGDQVYAKDICEDDSTSAGFTGGGVVDLFNDLKTTITNSTTDNPKTIVICMERSVSSTGIAIGDVNGGTHQSLKIEVQRGGDDWITVEDNSSSVVPFNARFYSWSVQTRTGDNIGVIGFTKIRLTFNTTATISISNIVISKIQEVQSSLLGLKTDGSLTYIGATNNSNLKVSVQEYGDTPAIDAFDRLRISEPFTLFDSKQLHDKQPLFWDEELGGSATSVHTSTHAETKMSVTTSSSDYAIRQTKQRFNYQPGKSQLIFMTFHSPQATGATKRIGTFDGTGVNYLTPNNGIFFECNGDLTWNIAKDGTTTESAAQDDWNIDKLDSTGKSGITLDMDSTQIIIIDFEWLGVGRVRVGFVIDGLIYYVHNFNHSNDPTFTSVYMSSPNLPLRYDIQTDGTEATHLDHICSTVISEGGIEKTGILRGIDNGTSYITALGAGTTYALLGIRLKAAYNDITVIPESLSAIAGTNDAFRWSLHINPTISGTFTYSDITDSAVQWANGTSKPTITADGIVIASGYASTASKQTSESLNTALRIGSTIAGVQDTLVLAITPITANMSTLTSLEFRELL